MHPFFLPPLYYLCSKPEYVSVFKPIKTKELLFLHLYFFLPLFDLEQTI